MLKAVFASSLGGGFGLHPNLLPWPRNKEDLSFFKDMTMRDSGVVYCGRNTAIGLPPLPGRSVVVISSGKEDLSQMKNPLIMSLPYKDFIKLGKESLFGTIIGGAALLTPETLGNCHEVYHTSFKHYYTSDVSLSKETLGWLGTNSNRSEVIYENELFLIRKYTNA
jgi:dihydrofolate reductase